MLELCVLLMTGQIHLLIPSFYSKVFHVRSVTQGDVIRAEAKDIPRIFQVRVLNDERKSNIFCLPTLFTS